MSSSWSTEPNSRNRSNKTSRMKLKRSARTLPNSNFNQTLNEQYAEDLSEAADNERKKLELENEMLQKQIEARKLPGRKPMSRRPSSEPTIFVSSKWTSTRSSLKPS